MSTEEHGSKYVNTMNEEIIMKRDCQAVLIPAGTKVTLQAGVPVIITQALGGSYTVISHGNMARIAGADADALGQGTPPALRPPPPSRAKLTEEQVLEVLRTCYDPEIPVNIVELGLVYDLQILPLPAGGYRVGDQDDLDRARLRHGARLAAGRRSQAPGPARRQGSRRLPGLGPALEPRHALRGRQAPTGMM